MRDLIDKADEVPVTLVVLIAYVTMAFLTGLPEPDPEKLAAYGSMRAIDVGNGEWWRLFTSSFLHGGLLHLAMNSWALIQLGPAVERSLGSARFLTVYLLAQLGSGLAVALVNDPFQPVVGGSGAIFGILGAIVAMQMRQGRHAFSFLAYEGPRRLLLTILAYLVLGALIPFVSNTAHVGGLVGGFLAAFVYLVPPRQASATLQAWRAAIAALFLGLTFYAVLPITRWDWNWIQEEQAPTNALAQRFRLAKLKSYHGRNDVDASDGAAFNRDMKRRAAGK